MNVSEFTESSSALLKKEDIGNARPRVMIERVDITEFDGQRKLVLHFNGKTKALALNRTNTMIMAAAYGPESDDWLGQIVELWVDPFVQFGGKMVGGIKLTPRSAPNPQPPPMPQPMPHVPMPPAGAVHPQPPPNAAHATHAKPDFEDSDIPF